MTVALSGKDIAGKLEEKFPGSTVTADEKQVLVKSDSLLLVAGFLKDTPEIDLSYLNFITAVDYGDYFEVVYRISSLEHNHWLTLKTRVADRESPALTSVYGVWPAADFQEREIYDLMGIKFNGHPNMKRIFLWDGFAGHPLRKDYL
ncbi:MAG: NADH-quinone oxidoreductase subunit C [Chloroflexota bacterium]